MNRGLLLVGLLAASVGWSECPVGAAEDLQKWLESDLPPLFDVKKEPPFVISSLSIRRNDIGQELLRGEYRRSWLITVLPREVKLVILPSGGGRYALSLWGPAGIVNGPQSSDVIGGISDNLLDFRGQIPGGARAYLEMLLETPGSAAPRFRISRVHWLGTDEQLVSAVKQGPPPQIERGVSADVKTVELPADTHLIRGVPLRFFLGGFHRKATVWGDSADGPVTVLVFLARPGGLYHPWIAQAERKDLRVEPGVLDELTQNDDFFRDAFQTAQRNLERHDAPRKLVPAAEHPIAAGQRLMQFSLGSLESVEAVAKPDNGVVLVRSPKGGKESRRELAHLYVDPTPAPVQQSSTGGEPNSTTSPANPKPAPDSFVKLEADAKLKVKDRLKASWGGRWYEVEVLEVVGKDKVRIHWIGWGSNWDEVRAVNSLFRDPNAVSADGKPVESFRTWHDSSGTFELEAALVEVQDDNVVLRRKSDGKLITIPRTGLSDSDQEFVRATASPAKKKQPPK